MAMGLATGHAKDPTRRLQRGRHDRVRCVRLDVWEPWASASQPPVTPDRLGEGPRLGSAPPIATKFRRVGLITYGPGPTSNAMSASTSSRSPTAAAPIMARGEFAPTPAGRTPLTSGVDARRPRCSTTCTSLGVVVVVTDGEETCGGSPCDPRQ